MKPFLIIQVDVQDPEDTRVEGIVKAISENDALDKYAKKFFSDEAEQLGIPADHEFLLNFFEDTTCWIAQEFTATIRRVIK